MSISSAASVRKFLPLVCLWKAVDQLTDVEKTVLAERRATLLSTLDQGFGPLTWTSLCIPEFISTVQQVCPAARLTAGACMGGTCLCSLLDVQCELAS